MTGEQKTAIASFLDLSADCLAGGYARPREPYRFEDDREPGDAGAGAAGTEAGEDSLEGIAAQVRSCRGCGLWGTRTNAVPGEGVSSPLVLVIGEGPGADEDSSGRPFVGKAGQLLDKMLGSIGLSRERNCFIANVVKCRPPENRDPLPGEAEACAPFLARQIRLLRPRLILCMGKVAANRLLGECNGLPGFREPEAIGRLRGRFYDYPVSPDLSIPLLATYHPSALLHNEDLKRPAWEDLKKLRAFLAETGGI
ncbi:MAG: uracil-DNA glycosylase [Treponema sp.]|jgi:DNA polymerase|nr:uracil-DNA glycosylase [Treponema sp.]